MLGLCGMQPRINEVLQFTNDRVRIGGVLGKLTGQTYGVSFVPVFSHHTIPTPLLVAVISSVGCRFESCWDRHPRCRPLCFQLLTSEFGKPGFGFANFCS